MKWSLSFLLCATALAGAASAETRSFTVDEGTNFAAAMSPDGTSIAIDLQGELRLVPAGGGRAAMLVELPDEARLPSWSPDGRWLAFQHFIAGQWRIFVIGRNGKGLRQLTSGAADDREPVWTADGKTLLFSSDRSGNFDIWKVAAVGGAPERITSTPADEYFPAASADGRIAFVSATSKGRDLVL
ncbi:MAG: TolB family protein, partial [Sphingomonadaceae bacterium]